MTVCCDVAYKFLAINGSLAGQRAVPIKRANRLPIFTFCFVISLGTEVVWTEFLQVCSLGSACTPTHTEECDVMCRTLHALVKWRYWGW